MGETIAIYGNEVIGVVSHYATIDGIEYVYLKGAGKPIKSRTLIIATVISDHGVRV